MIVDLNQMPQPGHVTIMNAVGRPSSNLVVSVSGGIESSSGGPISVEVLD
jgi:hypothetical protein